jgi:hypothetical protein
MGMHERRSGEYEYDIEVVPLVPVVRQTWSGASRTGHRRSLAHDNASSLPKVRRCFRELLVYRTRP